MSNVNHKILLIAIEQFLEHYFHKGYEDIGSFLSSLLPIEDGSPADPAFYEDWLKIIDNRNEIERNEAYFFMISFINYQSKNGWSELNELIKKENLCISNDISVDKLSIWHDSIKKATNIGVDY